MIRTGKTACGTVCRAATAVIATALITTLASGCNVALVDGAYHGEPLIVLSGQVQIVPTKIDGTGGKEGGSKDKNPPKQDPQPKVVELPAGTLRLAVMWSDSGVEDATASTFDAVEQAVVTTSSFPARYTLELYTPPPSELLHDDTDTGSYALGLVVAYADADDDGAFDPATDSLLGGAPGRAVLYTPGGITAKWLDGELGEGYHRVRRQGAGKPCNTLGHVRLELDPDIETHLALHEEFPDDLLLDLDCNGKQDDWRKNLCPPRKELQKHCPKAPPEHYICKTCPY